MPNETFFFHLGEKNNVIIILKNPIKIELKLHIIFLSENLNFL